MKVKLFFALPLCIIISSFIFYECGSNKIAPDVCFNKNILPIFISKCTTSGCHSGGNGNHRGRANFTTYEGIMTQVKPYHPLLSSVYTKCTGINPSMPPSSYTQLTNTELQYIKYWIHIGAKNSLDCGLTCDTINFTFSTRILPLITLNCVGGCHNSSNPFGGFDLSNYAGIKNCILSNKLMSSINVVTGTMPKGTAKLSTCDIRTIQKWVDAGYQDN